MECKIIKCEFCNRDTVSFYFYKKKFFICPVCYNNKLTSTLKDRYDLTNVQNNMRRNENLAKQCFKQINSLSPFSTEHEEVKVRLNALSSEYRRLKEECNRLKFAIDFSKIDQAIYFTTFEEFSEHQMNT